MVDNYLSVLEQSLIKKIEVLNCIQDYNAREHMLFSSENISFSVFDSYVDEKEKLIRQVISLDEGFENLYASVAAELKDNKEHYREQIQRLQSLVNQVTELSVAIQIQETRNKKLVEKYFSKEKSEIGQNRRTSKVAYDYYKNMSGSSVVSPQFMDKKK